MTGPEDLFRAALRAREHAYAPFSNFAVGVAIRTESGRIFSGANIENQSFPEGWCAETTAISHMIMAAESADDRIIACLLYTSPSPRDATLSRMPSSA